MRSLALTALLLLGCPNPPATGGTGGGSAGGAASTGGGSGGSGGSGTGGSGTGGGTSATGGGTSSTGGGTSATGGGTSATGGGTSATGGGTAGAGGAGGGTVTPSDAGTLVRFIAIGDTGKGNQSQTDVGNAIATWCNNTAHPCDFVVMLGDNIYDEGVDGPNDAQWVTKFEQPYAAVNLPFWAVLGNHDYGASGSGTDMARGANEVAYAAKPGQTKFKMPAKHYRFTAGHAEFFGTDTNEVYVGGLPISFGFDDAQQRANFNAWIAASTATWKISLGHHPYRSNGPHGNAGTYEGLPTLGNSVKSFFDQVLCGKVDVSLSGHDHSIQWITPKCGTTELIVSGGGASTTTLTTNNATYYQTDKSGFVYIVLQDRTFTGTIVDSMGNVLFTRMFAK